MFEFYTLMLPENPGDFLDVTTFSRDRDVGIVGTKVYFWPTCGMTATPQGNATVSL